MAILSSAVVAALVPICGAASTVIADSKLQNCIADGSVRRSCVLRE